LIFGQLMFALLLVLMEGYQRHLHHMCDKCGSYVMATSISIMGLLCFFFHFRMKLLLANLSTLLNWRVPHISSILQIWKNVEKVHGSDSDMVELANSLFQLFESLIESRYDCLIILHRVATSCICLLSATECYVQIFLLLPKMWQKH
jgi:hypothetical protein